MQEDRILAGGTLHPGEHTIVERFELPAPLGVFAAAAAVAVALLFFVAIVSIRRERGREAPLADAPMPPPSGRAALALRGVALAAFLLAAAAGAWGRADPARVLAIWIVGWTGLALLCAAVVNVWPAIDPWASLDCVLRMRFDPAPQPWPEAWGARPAVLFLLLLAWLALVDPYVWRPSHLAMLLLAWTAVSLGGMARYGRQAWQRNADPIALYFAAIGRFAPLGVEDGRFVLRPWARRLVNTPPAAGSTFVVAMLAVAHYAALLDTRYWRDSPFDGTAGLLLAFALLFGLYRGACTFTTVLARDAGASRVAERFAPTLVPVAVAYQIAHGLPRTFARAQAVVDAGFLWSVAAIAIVGGHGISVWLVHRVALRAWPQHRRAIAASVPLTVLLVALAALGIALAGEPLTRYCASR